MEERDEWGKGLHIFIPRQHEGVLDGMNNRLFPLISNTPIQIHCPKRWENWTKFAATAETVADSHQWIFPPLVGGRDNVGDIYKLVCYFVHHSSDWKDSFFQPEYVQNEVLGADGSGWVLSNDFNIKSVLGSS